MFSNTSIVTGSVALGLVALDSIKAIKSIADRILRRQYDEASLAITSYRDEDGEATEESLRAFSDKWQRILIAVFSLTGLSTSLALSILSTISSDLNDPLANWLQFAIWVRTKMRQSSSCPLDSRNNKKRNETITVNMRFHTGLTFNPRNCFFHRTASNYPIPTGSIRLRGKHHLYRCSRL